MPIISKNNKLLIFCIVSAAAHAGLLLAITSPESLFINARVNTLNNNSVQVTLLAPTTRIDTSKPDSTVKTAVDISSKQKPGKLTKTGKVITVNPTFENTFLPLKKSTDGQNPARAKPVPPPASLPEIKNVTNQIHDEKISNKNHTAHETTNDTESTRDTVAKQVSQLDTRNLNATLSQSFQRYFNYPRIARKNGWQGKVTVALRIEPNGTLSNIHVVRTSGYPSLDSAAINSLKQIALLDGVDKWLRGLHYDTELPILYTLTGS